ncbi:sigma-70 family RNA polymerase sigma factor [Motiliproteus sp. SC1-56]|uniref:sigma-70 family RNA polymerase sigma factor n=1 Tax=Motiliproteus sp. SC1-56 TaxID=2799565 RepID=UPI001A8E7BE5|nr:sigma-70 family RNA polymerase sigma factor [Motiliproteus sp. SC1-56]
MNSFDQQLSEQIPALRRYARSLLHSGSQADDLVQDCLTRALERQHLWQAGTDLRAWLFTLMHNLFVNQLRRNARQPVAVTLVEDTPGDVVIGPEQVARNQQLHRQMARLPFPQREVLALVALEGFTYQQVAEILDIPIGTVMSRLNRARESMRQWLYSEPGSGLRRVK